MRSMRRERSVSAGAVILLHAAALWLLLHAREARQEAVPRGALATFDVRLPPPSAPAPERTARAPHAAGRAGRSGAIAQRSAVTAPIPIVAPPPSPSMPPTPQAGTAIVGGATATDTGSGAGEEGTGLGSGGAGVGAGGGGSRARRLSGAISPRDYPEAERSARIGGTVTVAFVVGVDGRVHDCTVAQSSGNATLDALTCRLLAARFRYAPARDAAGSRVDERRGWRQRWWIERD